MKVCIVCYGLREYNIRLQPWRYISEIASGIYQKNIDVTIITDGSLEREIFQHIPIINIKRLRKLPFQFNRELISVIQSEKPDVILWSVTALDYLYLNMFKQINIPIIGMFTGPIYKLSDITRIGTYVIIKNIKFLSTHVIYASLPPFFIRNLVNSPYCNKIFVMSRKNKEIIIEIGGNREKVVHIPAGIDEYEFEMYEDYSSIISRYHLDEKSFNILYFGSPLSIRGIDHLIKSISKVRSVYPCVKLLILSRRRNNELNNEEINLQNLILKLDIEKNVHIISGFLDKDEVKKFIGFSDLIVLPFKIVPSDVPTSVLESMAMGKVVVSTDIDGIPELLEDGRGFVVQPNKEEDLVEKIFFSIKNQDIIKNMGEKAASHMQTHPKWSEVSELALSEVTKIFDKRSQSEVNL
ncbi:glycosyltransferase (group I) [Methanosarcina siciliae T4/M]|uniref:Glycosyltransferase (Group I) n=1 Tax=Methanosarcina siciliae T4/M TaxID=1434120 RepID=A0A0E3P5R9_9EURY|nr:glycosyltransferase family 4 protein [Methanosarcina siciliae]AKB29150.1 glycosyltransferase (group I) [Methanosarcina siciliae T4/M]